MKRVIVLATHNPHKRDELLAIFRGALQQDIELKTLDDIVPVIGEIPETGTTLEENASIKAWAVYRWIVQHNGAALTVVADDTGLEVTALDGAPGVFSARYAGENVTYADNVQKLLNELQEKSDRSATFSTVIVYIDVSGGQHHFRGEVRGVITDAPRGPNGFGYDPVFAPLEDKEGRTFAEMTDKEKNAISHRGRALRELITYLNSGQG